MITFLKHTLCLIAAYLIVIVTLLIDLVMAGALILPALMVALFKNKGEDLAFLDLLSSKIGVMAILLALCTAGLYIAADNLFPSKFLPKAVNSILAVPLFLVGVFSGIVGATSFFLLGMQWLVSLPNILSAVICLSYAIIQLQPNK